MPSEIKAIQINMAGMKKDILYIKQELGEVKKQLTNCIPHKIEDLREDFVNYKSSQQKWSVAILTTLVFTLIGTIISLIAK